MGERVAHLITGRMLDYIEFDDGFAIAKVRAPRDAVGRSLADTALRSKWGVTVVGVKLPGQDFTYARPETVVPHGCLLIVAGDTSKVEHFAAAIDAEPATSDRRHRESAHSARSPAAPGGRGRRTPLDLGFGLGGRSFFDFGAGPAGRDVGRDVGRAVGAGGSERPPDFSTSVTDVAPITSAAQMWPSSRKASGSGLRPRYSPRRPTVRRPAGRRGRTCRAAPPCGRSARPPGPGR